MKNGGAKNEDLGLCAQGIKICAMLYGIVLMVMTSNSDGTIHIDVKADFVSAILSAGFHVKLAGGGHYSPDVIRAKVAEIQFQIPAGVGITLNSLYINPRQFTFQLPLWQEMRGRAANRGLLRRRRHSKH